MTVHLTNEHSQIYPAVKDEMSLPNVLYNTQESFGGLRENVSNFPKGRPVFCYFSTF